MNRKSILFYVIIVLFVITFVLTLLGVLKLVSIDDFYLKGLFAAFVLELAGAIYYLVKRGDILNENSSPAGSSITIIPANQTAINLTGKWMSCCSGNFSDECAYIETIEVEHENGNVRGIIVNVKSPDSEDLGKSYKFNATFSNGDLVGTYHITDKTRKDSGCFYLVRSGDGTEFKGMAVIYDHPKNELLTTPYTWKRK